MTSRPPVLPAEDKIRIMLSVLARGLTTAEAAGQNKVSKTSVGKWKPQFLEAGRAGLAAGGSARPSPREEALAAEVEEPKSALREAHVELRVWKKSAEARLAPWRTSR
jgi:transposase